MPPNDANEFDLAIDAYLADLLEQRVDSLDALFERFPERRAEIEMLVQGAQTDGPLFEKGDLLPPLPNHIDPGMPFHQPDTDRTNVALHDTERQTGVATASIEARQANSSTELPRRLGSYELFALIDQGGMGVVYKARTIDQPIERLVAVKIIKPEIGGQEIRARFARECQSLALMNHPNIATIFEGGLTDEGNPFLAMELVDGQTLMEHCVSQALSTKRRLEIFSQICKAIQHAHQKGIIHRDLKPSNILVSKSDGVASPKIIDFGLAKRETEAGEFRSSQTQLGQILGTLHYMSPEGARLSSSAIDTRSDVFSLGVILFELLTETTPLDKELDSQVPFDERLRAVRSQEPSRPSDRIKQRRLHATTQTTQTAPDYRDVQGDLDAICCKALANAADSRYDSAAALARDIDNYLVGAPVDAKGTSQAYLLSKLAYRYRKQLAIAAFGLSLLVFATAASVVLAIQASQAEAKASRQLESANSARKAEAAALLRAEAESEVAQEINRFLRDDLLMQADPSKQTDPRITLREVVDIAATNLDDDAVGNPRVRGEIHATIAEIYLGLQDYERADPHWREAYALLRESLGEGNYRTINANQGLAQNCLSLGLMQEAEDRIRTNLQLIHGTKEDVSSEVFGFRNDLALVLKGLGREVEAVEMLKELMDEGTKMYGEDSRKVNSYTSNLATTLMAVSRYSEALPYARRAVEFASELYEPGNPIFHTRISNLARCLAKLGAYDESHKLLEEQRVQTEYYYERGHPIWQLNRQNYISCLISEGRLDEAEAAAMQLIKISEESDAFSSDDRYANSLALADVLLKKGDDARAIAVTTSTFKAMEAEYGPDHHFTKKALATLANHLNDAREHEAAKELIESRWQFENGQFDQVPAIEEKGLLNEWIRAKVGLMQWEHLVASLQKLIRILPAESVSWQVQRARLQHNVGRGLSNLGRIDEAEDVLRAALDTNTNLCGPFYFSTLDDQFRLADVLVKQKKFEEAERLYLSGLETNQVSYSVDNKRALHAIRELNDLADEHRNSGDYSKAIELHRLLDEYCVTNLGPSHSETISSRNGHGRTLAASGQRDLANEVFRNAIEAAGESTKKTRSKFCELLYNWGINLNHQEDWEQSAEVWGLAAKELQEQYGADHYRADRARIYHAKALLALDRTEPAIEVARDVFQIGRETSERSVDSKLDAMDILVDNLSLDQVHDFAIDLEALYFAVSDYENLSVWEKTKIAIAAAVCFRRVGVEEENLERALTLNQVVLDCRLEADATHVRTANAYRELGDSLFALERYREAEEAWIECIRVHKIAREDSDARKRSIDLATRCLVNLFRETGQDDVAEEWQAKIHFPLK